MDIYIKLPDDIKNRIFLYCGHRTAKIIKIHNSTRGKIMEDIRDYCGSINKLYKLPFAKDHNGKYGRARLLNTLWVEVNSCLGDYYEIWKRMYRIRRITQVRHWIGWHYAVQGHDYQIKSLWALFLPKERKEYLNKYS